MQNELFLNHTDAATREDHDLGNDSLHEFPFAFSERKADWFLAQLIEEIPWKQDSIWIAGKEIPVPRLQCWMGDRGSNYAYSGIRLEPEPWSSAVLKIKEEVESVTDQQFNSVLLNFYRNGSDSVSWHADDEKELGPHPIIASVSLGAERTFQFRPKLKTDKRRFQLRLRHGSVILMGKNIQNNWLHQIPKTKSINQPRVSLTFRKIF